MSSTATEEPAAVEAKPEIVTPAEAQAQIDPLPEVNPAAIKAEEERQQAPEPAAAPPADSPAPAAAAKPRASKPAAVDADGRPFDPLVHECTDDGKPVFRADGKTLKKRRTPLKEWKQQSRVELDPLNAEPAPETETEAAPRASEMEVRATAMTLAGVQIMVMRAAFGEKLAEEQAQQEELIGAWTRVLDHYGMGALHPVLGLGLVSGGVVVAAMKHEETQSKVQKLVHWMQHRALSVLQWIKSRFGGKPRSTAPRATGETAKAA